MLELVNNKVILHKITSHCKIEEYPQVTVVGAGPCGLRTAIEAQLLGARVTVIEKRTSFTRLIALQIY